MKGSESMESLRAAGVEALANAWTTVAESPSAFAASAVVTLAIILLTTRFLSSFRSKSIEKGRDGVWTVGMLPYWVPYIGHVFQFAFNQDKFLATVRDRSKHGIFAINMGGSTHNVIYSPSLVTGVFAQRTATEVDTFVAYIMVNFFGSPKSFTSKLFELTKDLNHCIQKSLMRDPGLGKMLTVTIGNMEAQLPHMVSFTSSYVDQSLWERVSDVRLVETSDGERIAEANLNPLMRNFIGYLASPAIMGEAFMENNPNVLEDIWAYDLGLVYFLMQLPRWVPIPQFQRAWRARDRLLRAFTEFHKALDRYRDTGDGGPGWRDMSDVGDLITSRYEVWRKGGVPPHLRADLPLLWAMNVNANGLTFWLLSHILANPGLLARIRTEVEPYATATQPDNIHGISEPPRLRLNIDGLRDKCPLLKSCYYEALRLDSAPWSWKRVSKDFVIKEDEGIARGLPKSFQLKAGEYLEIPFDVHQMDPRYWPEPEVFKPERFIVRDEKEGRDFVDIATLRPYGGGASICKGKVFAEAEILAYVAGIMVLWDFEPADGGDWVVPEKTRGSAVAIPKGNLRVQIKRGKLPVIKG